MAMPPRTLTTGRLLLRPWRDSDHAPFRALNADPEVMRYFPKPLSDQETDALIASWQGHIEQHGWGFWAVERSSDRAFVGAVGMAHATFPARFTPAVEIGWRICRPCWRQGYTLEAAREALRFGFDILQLAEIVAFTLPSNQPSRMVMERLGMSRDPGDDFEHPSVDPGHPMRPHVLYRLGRATWQTERAGAAG